MGLGRFLTYKMDAKVLAASLCLSIATFGIYLGFFDILVPFIPGGSVRSNSGAFFVLPVFLLVSGQTLFATWLTHMVIGAISPEKRDALKAYLVAATQILLFSGFYVLFPDYGPYTFVVYFMPNERFAPISLPVVMLWTVVIVLGTYLLTRRVFRFEESSHFGRWRRLLLSASMLALIMVMAS